ncbi:MAG: LysM peptidoglycan-binding domain-containing protein [Thermoflexaceae bacterium]|nr:LysM peptidoglycan-binding domain-containing protein [Thermoflexaceae bacterium]
MTIPPFAPDDGDGARGDDGGHRGGEPHRRRHCTPHAHAQPRRDARAHGVARAGHGGARDTFESIAAALGSKATAAELRRANGLAAGDLAVGTKVAVPVRDDAGVVPVDALATALRKGGGIRPPLFVPGGATLDGFQGRVALHALEIANGDSAGEAYGYRLEFWSTASAAAKGGVLDLQAQVDGPLFTVAAGPFAAKLTSARAGDRFAWTRNGVEFAVRMEGAGATPEQVAASLEAK